MRSVEENSKSVYKDNDDEKEKQFSIPEQNENVAEETRRLLSNPSLIHDRKSRDIDEWLDEMKFYAWKSRGIPESRRKELWLTLAEKYFRSKCINWQERRSTSIYIEDRDMEDQIIKDLHRTGSAFCSGPNSIINQGKLKHLLLEYAQWNPKVGYCQGFNVLGAFILQIMEKEHENSLKIMVYLLEGVLPTGYYSESLVGLQIDMAVFRQLMFEQLPKLATHLQSLENGQGFDEPPLTNLFTMQWFLTIFCTCLSMPSLLRIWDLIFLEGNEVIFRTSLAIWSIMERYVAKMNSIDDFYGNMGILFQRLCTGSMCDPAELIRIISRFKPILNLHVLRVKHKQHSERNKRPNKTNAKSSLPSPSQSKSSVGLNQKLVRDSNKKVNITNIDMSVFKKQYEKLKRRPSLELNTAVLSKRSSDGKTSSNFSVNKFWSNNNNNNSNINKKKFTNKANESSKNYFTNINKLEKKIDTKLLPHSRYMKPKKSPEIKQLPKSDKLDSIINNKDDNIIQSSDSSSTTSLCDNDDNDDDSLYECSNLNYYYSDSIDETCDNWPNIDMKNSEKDTSENVNLILEQIASYSSTSNNTSNNISETENVDNHYNNDEDDDNRESKLLLEVTTLPDTENVICDENVYRSKSEMNEKFLNKITTDEETNKELDFKEIEKWREKYLKTSNSEKNLENSATENEETESANINENTLNQDLTDSQISEISDGNNAISGLDYKNCTENVNLLANDTKLNENESEISRTEVKLKSSADKLSANELEINNAVTESKLIFSTNDSNNLQQDNSNIGEEGFTNELFDNLFQNKFSQFAKYAVKDYLEGIHYTTNSIEGNGETKTQTRTYYDVFKIIEENSKVLDSLSKKSNFIISPADSSSDNIQQESDKNYDKFKMSPTKDEELNESFSEAKTIKESQIDLTATDEISSSECNSTSLKTDATEIFENSNIELKIDTVEDEVDVSELEKHKGISDVYEQEEKPNGFLSDTKYYQRNKLNRSFDDKTESENENEFIISKGIEKEMSKSLEYFESRNNRPISVDSEQKEKEDEEKSFHENERNKELHKGNDNEKFSKSRKEIENKPDEIQISNNVSKSSTTIRTCDEKETLKKSEKFEILDIKNFGYEKKNLIYEENQTKDPVNSKFQIKNTLDKYERPKSDDDDEEIKSFGKFKDKESEEKYDHYWFIEKPEHIEKRRDSLRKSTSPIDSLKDSVLDSINLKSSMEVNSYKYSNKTENIEKSEHIANIRDTLRKSTSPIDSLKDSVFNSINLNSSMEVNSYKYSNKIENIEKPEYIEKRRDSVRKSTSPIDSIKDSVLDSINLKSSMEVNSYKYSNKKENIEKPEYIEKRRDSVRKSTSPIDSIKDSVLDSINLKSSTELNPYKYSTKTEDLISKIRLTNLDELEFNERKSSLSHNSSLMNSENMVHPSTKSVRIFESNEKTSINKIYSKYDEYEKESNYKEYPDNDNDTVSRNKSFDSRDTFLKGYEDRCEHNEVGMQNVRSRPFYESQTYDKKYFSRLDESDFKERLESIKNTIKFIDDLCDENDKINRKKKYHRDAKARKSLIFEDLLSKTPTSVNDNDNRFNKITTFNSSEQCSNKSSIKYNEYGDDFLKNKSNSHNNTIADRFKKNNSYENLNVQNENQQLLDNLNRSTYNSKIYDDTKESIAFESIEKKKSKSYSNIYFNKFD